jgi:2-(1,2-epoxy-1,2-dihydrophenyl)acetyl-CoA isomerase
VGVGKNDAHVVISVSETQISAKGFFMTQEPLLITKQHHITVLTLNSPEVRNAIDHEVMAALRVAVEACAKDGTRCIVLTGAGGAFCSGLNIKKAMANGMTPEQVQQGLNEIFHPTMKAIRYSPLPVIAAVDGYAAGFGCDLALACDLRLITERARFAELFIRLGLIPDGGGTYLLPRLVGLGLAMEMLFTARDVHAEEALRIGLANRVYPVEGFMDEVLAFAKELTQCSPTAIRRAKTAMIAALEGTYSDALAREASYQREIMESANGMEGFMAFLEKRDPVWRDE